MTVTDLKKKKKEEERVTQYQKKTVSVAVIDL